MVDLRLDHISKRYRIRQEGDAPATGNPLLRKLRGLRKRSTDFWAVRDVSFEARRGEALGIIGHNGAGKSTILKLLSNITTPTSGEMTINGRLSALIEVGSGFHPELTGRENVYLSGSILGMRRREIAAKLDSIVEFAGLQKFLDVPVKRYSSGMYVRLGFSIAAHLDPDILLLDEVLAVGDAAFQQKCLQRIGALKESGITIVFISHDLGAVERLCDRVLLMRQGELVAGGKPAEVIAQYQSDATNFVPTAPPPSFAAVMNKKIEVRGLAFFDALGRETSTFETGGPLSVRLEYEARERVTDAVFELFFYPTEGDLQCQLTTESRDEFLDVGPGRGAIEFTCPELGLQPGTYYVDVTITRREPPEGIEWQYRCGMLRVGPGKVVRGGFYMPHRWRALGEERTAADLREDPTLQELA
jgi:homopolymeric O-antigen transport system ATP-binding protein